VKRYVEAQGWVSYGGPRRGAKLAGLDDWLEERDVIGPRIPGCNAFTSPTRGQQHAGPVAEEHFGRRVPAEGQRRTSVVVVINPATDQPPRMVAAEDLLQVHRLVLQTTATAARRTGCPSTAPCRPC